MSKLTDSFIRGFGSSLGRAAAQKAIQSGGTGGTSTASRKKFMIALIILFLFILGIVGLYRMGSSQPQVNTKTCYLLKAGDSVKYAIHFRNRSHLSLNLLERYDKITGKEESDWETGLDYLNFHNSLEDDLFINLDSIFVKEQYISERDENFQKTKKLVKGKNFICTINKEGIANKEQLLFFLNNSNNEIFEGERITDIVILENK